MKELFENTWALEDNALKKAFFEKDENFKKLRESVEKSPVV